MKSNRFQLEVDGRQGDASPRVQDAHNCRGRQKRPDSKLVNGEGSFAESKHQGHPKVMESL